MPSAPGLVSINFTPLSLEEMTQVVSRGRIILLHSKLITEKCIRPRDGSVAVMVHKDSGYDSITAAELTFIEFRRRVKGTKRIAYLKPALNFALTFMMWKNSFATHIQVKNCDQSDKHVVIIIYDPRVRGKADFSLRDFYSIGGYFHLIRLTC